jgi:amino acid transporter
MVWGWLAASTFILFVGLAMAELASAAPTSGGTVLLDVVIFPTAIQKGFVVGRRI